MSRKGEDWTYKHRTSGTTAREVHTSICPCVQCSCANEQQNLHEGMLQGTQEGDEE